MTPSKDYYSSHFSRMEMLASETAARKGIPNIPTPEIECHLERLCLDVLEPLRQQFGPIRITSGYRSPELNAAIGGSPTSAHMDGRAADIQFLARPRVSMGKAILWLLKSGLPVDQAIFEFGAWVHVGMPRWGETPRRQGLMVFAGQEYQPFDFDDSRVT